jgi:hypothetical protein
VRRNNGHLSRQSFTNTEYKISKFCLYSIVTNQVIVTVTGMYATPQRFPKPVCHYEAAERLGLPTFWSVMQSLLLP